MSSVYLYHVEKRIHDISVGRPVPDVQYVPESETYNDVCLTYAEMVLKLHPKQPIEWCFDQSRSFNGIYLCRFYRPDGEFLVLLPGSPLPLCKEVKVYIDLNQTQDLSRCAMGWYL